MKTLSFFALAAFMGTANAYAIQVKTSDALIAAVRDGAEGDTIEIGAGTFELNAPLELQSRMTLKGAGVNETIITHAANWKPSTETLPDPEMKTQGMDTHAYCTVR